MSRHQGNFDAANFVLARLENHSSHRLVPAQDNLIDRLLVFAGMKSLVRFVLHVEKFADALLVPAKAAQIVAATALV
jgi:hypothetical protein